jgi:Flp pilus assembly protein TadB
MSTEPLQSQSGAPPAGERVHMPEHSILPLVNAAALAVAIVSLTLSWWLVAFAGAIFLLSTIRWILDVRRDIRDLPLDHDHH